MRVQNLRIADAFVATIIAAVCGMFIGYWCGREIILRHRESRLDMYAVRVLGAVENSSAEARSILDKLNASRFPHCSDQEIDFFRRQLFRSEYLKDAGRMENGRFECSTSFGRMSPQGSQFEAAFARANGILVYRDPAPFRVDGFTMIVIQRGDAYVVYNPYNLKAIQSPVMHFTISDREAPGGHVRQMGGESPGVGDAVLVNEGWARVGKSLYATRCSVRYSACITAFSSVSEALQVERSELRGYVAVCGFSGALLGFACSLLYWRNRSMEQQLRRAIRRAELELVYQPVVELGTRTIAGAEALARWTNEDGEVVSPEVFIKIAEERGFVGDITHLVVRRAVHDLKSILSSQPAFHVNINIAAADLSDSAFLPMLQKVLAEEDVPTKQLGIEITERSAARIETAQEAILQLRNKGHVVLIDDFGTGYSSLACLQDLAVDVIKIDKAFTHSIGTGSVKVSILPQILAMAAALDLHIVVEGIETEEQARYFAELDRPVYGQGWLLGRPMPIENLLRLLEETASPVSGAAIEA